jgi:acyl carrier protein
VQRGAGQWQLEAPAFDKSTDPFYTSAINCRPADIQEHTSMDKIEIQEKLIDILTKHTSIDKSAVTPEKHLKFDLGLDSLDVAEMVYEMEETFGIKIPDDSADKIQKISDTVDFIYEQMNSSTQPKLSV